MVIFHSYVSLPEGNQRDPVEKTEPGNPGNLHRDDPSFE